MSRPEPGPRADALTSILESVHLAGSLYCRSELSAPWGMRLDASDDAHFFVVRRGRCWLRLEGQPAEEALETEAGDLVVLPRGDAFRLTDRREGVARPLAELLEDGGAPRACGAPLVFGGGGERTVLVCGYFRFDRGQVHPLLSVLPRVLVVRGEGGRARPWLEGLLELIAAELGAGRAGGELLVDRLTEALLIQVIRSHVEEASCAAPSWLAGLRDPQIASALALLHEAPERRWTLGELAARVGMSRSSFAARFRALVGEPPLTYLTRWRVQVAANHLREGRLTLAQVAAAVGYGSEASFSRIFKRLVGLPPGAFRRHHGPPRAGA